MAGMGVDAERGYLGSHQDDYAGLSTFPSLSLSSVCNQMHEFGVFLLVFFIVKGSALDDQMKSYSTGLVSAA